MNRQEFIEKYEKLIKYKENVDFPDKWTDALNIGMEVIQKYLESQGFLNRFEILQIKEKAGSLRFCFYLDESCYWNIDNAWLTGAVRMMERYVSKIH